MFAPATRGVPYNWANRRIALLERPDNVLRWAVPFGYVSVFYPRLGEDLELQYLVETQDKELAPMWLELLENGIAAVSQSSARSADDDDDTTVGDTMAGDLNEEGPPTEYEVPTDLRRELWWKEEDEYRWHCGPIIKATIIPREEGKVSIKCTEAANLTKQQQTEWLQHLALELKVDRWMKNYPADHILNAEHVRGARDELAGRREFYGPNWPLSLLTKEEQDALPQWKRCEAWLNAQDTDNARYTFDVQDQEAEFNKDRAGYAGNGSLGFDDWEYSESDYHQDIDFDPEKVRLFELGEWGD